MKNCGDGGAGGSRVGCRGLRPLPGFGAASQNLCRSTTSQALRAAKGRKKRGSLLPHRFPHPPPPLVSLPSQISAFCALAARSPCICSRLRVALRCAQQPTGLTLPFAPPGWRFRFCPLNRRGGRWPRPPLVSRSTFGSLCRLWRQVSRLLNHSRVPDGRAHGFAAPLRVALPPLAATAHRAGASLRATGLTLPFGVPKPVPQHNLASVASGQRPQETRLIPPASFFPIRGRRGIIPPAAHLFAPLRQGFAPCAPKPAIKPYQQRSQSP